MNGYESPLKGGLKIGLAAWLALLPVCLPAQTPAGAPDAMIQIKPSPAGFAFALNFPAKVSHADVKRRIERLSQLTGWRFSNLEIKDTDVRTNPKYGREIAIGIWTDVSATLANAPQEAESGGYRGFLLQPYIEALSDLNRFQILYWTPTDPKFRGITAFETRALAVHLVQPRGPYLYNIEIRAHDKPLPKLPLLEQPAQARAAPGNPAARPAEPEDRSLFAAVVGIAAGAAFMVLVTLLIVSRLRATRPLPPRAGKSGLHP